MFRLVTPQTDEQLANYYHFRWRMLREPWQMPKGSERDAYDDLSEHRMIINNRDQVVAIGRLYLTPDNEGQVRFMAVDPEVRHHGLGGLILMALESLARQDGAKRMVCNAREDAIPFYLKNGFASEGELSDERGPVRHQQMLKHLEPLNEVVRHPDWCHELQTLWQQQIPISDKMGIKINQYTGYRFEVSALFNANLNPNEFMFAGSIFTMATLAGWGFIWLLLKERGLEGNIVLVDSHIRYSSPVTERPKAVSTVENLRGDIDRLAKGRKGRISIDVNVYSGNNIASSFTGTYLILPLHVENEFTSL
ncbi:bifunctional GNAT family N-acetyltransferase/hotdog fold thioesterase [Photobacterium leiognathi]|uniref:bifunctional GNAT family N-acetyltransferase/hotdog fold thioesterase n=1 Tax=Photobacterium leiognathi TaxID=553611 RepID=UPI000D17D0D4|nr:bifunctional GNAT family N-acetyltransferase/hotdog fold thioesterase [Photobacterium leiognathi]PSW55846.1 GNAT family N-acetyltransferase [Photobacterium leiognathi subsp. mandapamensis]